MPTTASRRRTALAIAIATVLLGACTGSDDPSPSSPGSTTSPGATAGPVDPSGTASPETQRQEAIDHLVKIGNSQAQAECVVDGTIAAIGHPAVAGATNMTEAKANAFADVYMGCVDRSHFVGTIFPLSGLPPEQQTCFGSAFDDELYRDALQSRILGEEDTSAEDRINELAKDCGIQ